MGLFLSFCNSFTLLANKYLLTCLDLPSRYIGKCAARVLKRSGITTKLASTQSRLVFSIPVEGALYGDNATSVVLRKLFQGASI